MFRATAVLPSRPALLPVFLVAVLLVAGVRVPAAETQQLTSHWRERDIRIDGLDEEWRDLTQPVKGQRFAVGFVNDDEALYFCLVAKDQGTLRQISTMGLILWLDPAGGKKKTFGVRFPVGNGPVRGRPGKPRDTEPGEQGGGAVGETPAAQRDIEVLGPGNKDVREVENGPSGIVGRFTVRDDLLVYELKVPLRRSESVPFAPDVEPGAALRVGLQTPEWRGPVPMPRGGAGVVLGRPGGPSWFPGANAYMLRPLDIAADLRLATK